MGFAWGLAQAIVLLATLLDLTEACKVLFNGGPETALLTKRSPADVPICLILNDRYLFSSQVKFDTYTRLVIKGSFDAVTAPNACAVPDSIWFPAPLSCAWNQGSYGPGLGLGAPTNFYVSVQGVTSNYRKRYAFLGNTPQVPGVFPLLTIVIQVSNGIVKQVYWDDNCYFNFDRDRGTTSGATSMDCQFNAFDIPNLFTNTRNTTYRSFLNPTSKTSTGFDTLLTVDACKTNIWRDPSSTSAEPPSNVALPPGFCDLGIYVTWVGTSADGQQLGSASPRFKRMRDYAMLAQYPTVSFRVMRIIGTTSV